MKVLLTTFGSRGDVQPIAALGGALSDLGHEVRVCAPPDAETVELLKTVDVELVPAFTSVREWVKKMLARPPEEMPDRAAEIVEWQYEVISPASENFDLMLTSGLFPSTAASRIAAEVHGIDYVYATFCPIFFPSPHRAPFEYPLRPHPPKVTDVSELWERDIDDMNFLFGEGINAQRRRVGLESVENVRDYVFTNQPWLAADPVLAPWLEPSGIEVTQTGAWILPDSRPLPEDLDAFLAAGPPPVYAGFGSMPMSTSPDAAEVVVEAIRNNGCRALVGSGWADLELVDEADDCFVIGEVNQQALFTKVAAIIHHGGAGTTTAATASGTPQVLVPQLVDQPYFAERVWDLGVGTSVEGPTPEPESLSAALTRVLQPAVVARARSVGRKIDLDGAKRAAMLLTKRFAD